MMFDFMQSVLLIFIEMMCCKIFYETFGEVRHKGWINTVYFIAWLHMFPFVSLFGTFCNKTDCWHFDVFSIYALAR